MVLALFWLACAPLKISRELQIRLCIVVDNNTYDGHGTHPRTAATLVLQQILADH